MRQLGQLTFPENSEEARLWKSVELRRILHSQVMVWSHTRIEGTWCAYCFPVPGRNHDAEEYLWRENGAKLLKGLAEYMFPEFDGIPYAP